MFCKLLKQKSNWNIILKIASKLMVNKLLRCRRRVNILPFMTLGKDGFKYLSQEFYNKVLDLVKKKGFYRYEHMADFKKFNEQLPSKKKF